MQIKPLTVGNRQINNNVFLAPMAGYTDYAFRKASAMLGYGLTFTELISAKGLVFGGEGSLALLNSADKEKTSVQLFGEDADFFKRAIESDSLKDFDFIDINMGCPVPKLFKNGEGSALLGDINKAEKIIKTACKCNKIISVKIRTGLKYGDDIAEEFTKMAEGAGASLVTIHARVREAYYSGEPDYNAVYKAKKAVKIPVIANGGIKTSLDATRFINETGADGVMLARGAIENPFLINEILQTKPPFNLKQFILNQLEFMLETETDEKSAVLFRKFVSYYLKGKTGVKNAKIDLMKASKTSEIKEIICQIL